MDPGPDLEPAFRAAVAAAELESPHRPLVEVCAVLERLPADVRSRPDRAVIDQVDEVMDRLYRARDLSLRGDRWLSESPATIRGMLLDLFDRGHIARDHGRWTSPYTLYFSVMTPERRRTLAATLGIGNPRPDGT